jgi:hypothetical protein
MANEKNAPPPPAPLHGSAAEPKAIALQRAAVVAAEIMKSRVQEYEASKAALAACEKALEESRALYIQARDAAGRELGRIAGGGAP